ncbi:hypothetical protein ACQ4M4_10905 [Leptolyngbya sp. AN02str]|uniref:hypothetical protein n=1 Tax=Leptolyngbya sp. AN02str TaxID=3423363 RepID=UPI003D312628
MTAKVMESFGSKLAEQWVATLLTPAFIFWLGGFLTAIQRLGLNTLVTQYTAYPEPLQIAILVGALCIVAASAFVVQRFDTPIIRFLEGYWHPWLQPVRQVRIAHYHQHKQVLIQQSQTLRTLEARQKARFQALKTIIETQGATSLNSTERDEYRQLNERLLTPTQQETLTRVRLALHNLPANPDLMPTRMGNILRTAERRPLEKYGLDAIICWSRLWLLLPEAAKKDLQDARADLNNAARLWLWSILFLIWAALGAWWAVPLGILSALFSYYTWAIAAATTYGDLIEASFDLHRQLLYQALGWKKPDDPKEERRVGQQLTDYLWRGF